jgi:hypothetical protein
MLKKNLIQVEREVVSVIYGSQKQLKNGLKNKKRNMKKKKKKKK